MRTIRYLLGPAMILASAGCLPQARYDRQMKGKPAPDFKLTALDGSEVRLSDFRGKPVVVNFWAYG